MITQFIEILLHYLLSVIPILAIGFLLSGIIHEFIPAKWIEKYLSAGGIKPILYSTLVGTIFPICCWGSLPVAISFYRKGSRLGPVLAFLIATPATSVSALMVSFRLLGAEFTIYIFFSVILMGLIMGMLGNTLKFKPKKPQKEICPKCEEGAMSCEHCEHQESFAGRIKSILKFAFIDMPKDIGLEIILGLILAAAVGAIIPLGRLIKLYLSGLWAYLFSVLFGLVMYFCSTASVPLIDALLKQGMNRGAGLVLILVGPITTFGTILVLRKEFGAKVLFFYIGGICTLSVLLGYLYQIIS